MFGVALRALGGQGLSRWPAETGLAGRVRTTVWHRRAEQVL